MSTHYGSIAFTPLVRAVQAAHGSEDFYGPRADRAASRPGVDPLGQAEKDFLAQQDGFYLATISESGWPYVQYRGGPTGFLRVLSEHSLGWADFRGNLQYVSTGNITGDDRVAIIVMDYARRQRLKVFGHAHVEAADPDSDYAETLEHPTYAAVVERHVVVEVDAYDWNCPQHISVRYTQAQVTEILAPLQSRVTLLEAENARLRSAQTP